MLLALLLTLNAHALPPPHFQPRPPECDVTGCPDGQQCFGALGRFFCVEMPECSSEQPCGPGETCVQTTVGPRCAVGGHG